MSAIRDKVQFRQCPKCNSYLLSVGKIRKDKVRIIRCSECLERWDEVT